MNGPDKYIENVWLPVGIDDHYGSLTVSAYSTLAGSIGEGISYLVNFPYGCNEQVASALLPNLAVKQIIDLKLLKTDFIDQKDLQSKVEVGLQALYKGQKENGGWGVWPTSEATPYLTSYVLYAS